MKLTPNSTRFQLFVLFCLEAIDAVVHSTPKSFHENYKLEPEFTIQTVSLTQKGYIQFLKYAIKVPPLTDYTFCIWVKSNNLTFSHPLFSYSKHESERLIRVWISPMGRELNLEILHHPITSVPVNMIENRWYHVCQSWNYWHAIWNIFLNGQLISTGWVPKLKGVPIKGGGDIVIGQEYTDFDKGLDDGIEGDVFGFNFVLASAPAPPSHQGNQIRPYDHPTAPWKYHDEVRRLSPRTHNPQSSSVYLPVSEKLLIVVDNNGQFPQTSTRIVVPSGLGYLSVHPKRTGRNYYSPLPYRRKSVYSDRILSNDVASYRRSLGQLLVELTLDCAFMQGAPLRGNGVLINWTRTPVRVYGGAILEKVPAFCRQIGYSNLK